MAELQARVAALDAEALAAAEAARVQVERHRSELGELRTQGPEHIVIALAGNKSDLGTKREVDSRVAAA